MKVVEPMFPNARIPYGTWGSSYFPAWQASALAEVNIAQFAGEAMANILGKRKVSRKELDYLVVGSTIPWHWKFWNGPVVASCMGQRIPGFQMEQACATGLSAVIVAGSEVNSKSYDVAGVLTFDRTSDSPVGVFPERRAYRRTEVISDVWDNFGFDPSTGSAMLETAGKTARKYKIDRAEVDELTALRYKQYFDAKKAGFQDKYLFSFDILNTQGRLLGKISEDVGVREISLKTLKEQRELDSCITSGTQTHAADGMATLLVASVEKAKEISLKPEINIEFISKVDIRTGPGLMPEAPGLAVQKLLDRTGLTMNDMKVVKNHNPFAVNDAIFGKTMNYDWAKMNNTGCSLVWGHPQAPTLTRTIIEALEEAVDLGGGYVLVFGCAAGDVGTAGIFRVS